MNDPDRGTVLDNDSNGVAVTTIFSSTSVDGATEDRRLPEAECLPEHVEHAGERGGECE
mgnify:CR=1 FL=1